MSGFLIYVLRSQKLPCYLGLTEVPGSLLATIPILERTKALLGSHEITLWPEGEVQVVPVPILTPSSPATRALRGRGRGRDCPSLLGGLLSLICERVLPAQVLLRLRSSWPLPPNPGRVTASCLDHSASQVSVPELQWSVGLSLSARWAPRAWKAGLGVASWSPGLRKWIEGHWGF